MSTTVTLKNTKSEILEAYQKALTLTEKNKSTTIADVQEVKRIQEITKNAKELVGMGILNPEITDKYNNLLESIQIAEKELNELFGIKKELLSFEAIMIAKANKTVELDTTHKETMASLDKQIKDRKSELEVAVQKMNNEWCQVKRDLEVQRKREMEEYTYKVNRERAKENDAWADEKAQREKELAERELKVEERESYILSKENELTDLKVRVDNIPVLLDQAYENGMEKQKAKSNQSHAIEKAHTNKEHEWEVKGLNAENNNLQIQLDAEKEARAILEEKLEKAYEEIKAIATETVKNSGVRVIESQRAN